MSRPERAAGVKRRRDTRATARLRCVREESTHIRRQVLEHPDEARRGGLVVENKANFDNSKRARSDECVAEQRVYLGSAIDHADDVQMIRTVGPFTLEEIIRACSCALIPHPVMMMLVRSI